MAYLHTEPLNVGLNSRSGMVGLKVDPVKSLAERLSSPSSSSLPSQPSAPAARQRKVKKIKNKKKKFGRYYQVAFPNAVPIYIANKNM